MSLPVNLLRLLITVEIQPKARSTGVGALHPASSPVSPHSLSPPLGQLSTVSPHSLSPLARRASFHFLQPAKLCSAPHTVNSQPRSGSRPERHFLRAACPEPPTPINLSCLPPPLSLCSYLPLPSKFYYQRHLGQVNPRLTTQVPLPCFPFYPEH